MGGHETCIYALWEQGFSSFAVHEIAQVRILQKQFCALATDSIQAMFISEDKLSGRY